MEKLVPEYICFFAWVELHEATAVLYAHEISPSIAFDSKIYAANLAITEELINMPALRQHTVDNLLSIIFENANVNVAMLSDFPVQKQIKGISAADRPRYIQFM